MGKVGRRTGKVKSKHHANSDRVSKRDGVSRRQHSQKSGNIGQRGLDARFKTNTSHEKAIRNIQAVPSTHLKVPFTKHDNILLVGEGDFSFAMSLVQHHKFKHLTATSFDSKQALEEKYPGIEARLEQLQCSRKRKAEEIRDNKAPIDEDTEWNGFSPSPQNTTEDTKNGDSDLGDSKTTRTAVHYDIDATKLSTAHKKILKREAPFTKIIFNFPHVGGISTDVNRQVRSNQQLLVGFFNAAKSLLATPDKPAISHVSRRQQDTYASSEDDEDSDDDKQARLCRSTGHILVTLFEGEPYTLWNIRDLARHCGLKVVESFKFPWKAYPGYQHARTAGEIVTGKDRSDEGKRKGAWRGEERDARCYILALKEAEGLYPSAGQGKKRKVDHDDSD